MKQVFLWQMPELPLAGTVPVAVTLALGEVWGCVGTCCGNCKLLDLTASCVNPSWVWFCCFWLADVKLLLNRLHSLGAFVPHLPCFSRRVVHSPVPPAIPVLIEHICDPVHIVDEEIKLRFTVCFTMKVWSWKIGFENSFRQLLCYFYLLTVLLPASCKSLPSVRNLSDSTLSRMKKHWKAIQ